MPMKEGFYSFHFLRGGPARPGRALGEAPGSLREQTEVGGRLARAFVEVSMGNTWHSTESTLGSASMYECGGSVPVGWYPFPCSQVLGD